MSSISDKEYYHLTISINKALNPMEAPLKIKHARSAIITTHRTKEAKSFWSLVMRQPLMENRFTAWKFCHLLHKVLREGHSSTLKHSQTHKKMILEMGKLWGHLQDGVGNCIQAYSKLIVTKLDFHEKNSLFPGSLSIDFREIERFAGDDVNVYFQLCVEIFDYLDDILEVESRIFSSVNTYRMSSMTPQGQCRLAPMITLIQDSNPLYDLCVRVMFKLHDELPSDVLGGHRDRFRELFNKLKYFYDNVRPLQYFADLIQVPHLPEAAPNFTSKVDFGSYIPPVVYVQPDPEPVMDNLVDTTNLHQTPAPSPPQPSQTDEIINSLENKIREREYAIRELQNEVIVVKETYNSMQNNCKREIIQLREETAGLANDLACSKEMCTNMRLLKDELELKLANTPILLQKATEEEEKAKVSEEKFTKLKNMYTQIRDEHINLLRQHSESTKNLNKEQQEKSELNSEIEQLKMKIIDFEDEAKLKDKLCEENSELASKVDEITNRYELLQADHENLKQDYEKREVNKIMEIEQLTTKTAQLQAEAEELQQCKSKLMELEKSLNETVEKLGNDNDIHATLISKYKSDLETKDTELIELKKLHENLQQEYETRDANKSVEIEQLTTTTVQLQEEVAELQQCKSQIMELEKSLSETVEKFTNESGVHSTLISTYKSDLETKDTELIELKKLHENLQQEFETRDANKSVEIEQLTTKTVQLQEEVAELQQCKSKIMELEKSLSETVEKLSNDSEKHDTQINSYKSDLESKQNEIVELKRLQEIEIVTKDNQIKEILQNLTVIQATSAENDIAFSRLSEEKLSVECELQDLLQQNSELETKVNAALLEASAESSARHDSEIKYESVISSLLHCVLKSMEAITTSKYKETSQQQSFEKTFKIVEEADKLLNELNIVYPKYCEDKNSAEGLARKSILLGHNLAMLHEQCLLIDNTTTDIEKGQEIFNQVNHLYDPMLKLFQLFHNIGETQQVDHCISTIKSKLAEINKLIAALANALNTNVELGDLVENELQEMDKAIEEAAGRIVEMLSNARSKDNGIKLEVNEKILDACTTLMECIKLLIQKSKFLQEEIVSTGRGNTSVKEFYKRNSQWTEGLISASKSVAKGANLLVEAANKAVTSESNQNFEIIVAAQEIAASTAQLVIASKVKAPRESQKLSDLTKASRNVSQATGAVVATVKDCNAHLEQSLDIDFTKLTASQAKTMEIEIHVKVLELEQALQSERFKLSSFRKKHYQNTED